MKGAQWISVAIVVGGVAAFLCFDGPLRVSNWVHRGKTIRVHRGISGSLPWENRWIADPAISALAEKIVALTIEQTGCYGTCPVDIFRLERGRKAFYEGKEFVAQKGRYISAQFYFDHFDSLAYFAATRLMTLNDSYESSVTDHSTTIVTIEMTDGTKRISDYARTGPNDLLVFCAALEGVKASIEWIPEKTANQLPEPTPGGVAHR